MVSSRTIKPVSQIARVVKNPPAMQETKETWVRSLDQKNPLEEKLATHFSSLAWEIPRTEKPEGLQHIMLERVEHD